MRAILDDLDEDVRAPLVDRLLGQALKAPSALRPARLSPRIVADAQAFAEAARRVGQADPDDVTEHLRRASKAFVAGDHASARAVFEAIILPIATVDIDLGQHELVEEVLGVDAQMCVAHHTRPVFASMTAASRMSTLRRSHRRRPLTAPRTVREPVDFDAIDAASARRPTSSYAALTV
ncbi:MAG: hypothetical protein JNM38_00445 [Acidobacteria bacterium]|nr:hypothetical protein [Acidobacteriota bacterium]